ncbi:MAG TPA: carboxypeptidase-like regulatory domain-containing protein [Tepidisphaeraceae bacterium]
MFALSTLAVSAQASNVRGVVTQEKNGKPVENAVVRLMEKERDGKKLSEVDSIRTNSDGEFRFRKVEPGTYVVIASTKDRELRDRTTITVREGRDPEALGFKIRAGREDDDEVGATRAERARQYVNFVGQVVDKSGDPVRDAKVRLLTGDNDADTDKMVTVETVETDNKGRFEFHKVRFGNYVVDTAKGGDRAKKTVRLNDTDGTESVQLKLQ